MTAQPTTPAAPPVETQRRRGITSTDVLTGVLLLVLLGRPLLVRPFESAAMRTWATVFVAICVQALPFLVLGVLLSAAIAVFVPPSVITRVLPRHPAAAVPVAGAAGLVLPGCECSSVPVARGLIARGVTPAAALAFLLSAPAINPVVLVATSVAFPGRPAMVVARFVASLAAAVAVGWIWARFGRAEWLARSRRPETAGLSRSEAFRVNARHDFVHAGGFLVVGGLTAATLNVAVPGGVLDAVASRPWLSVLALAGLAVVLAICSEADAFVAASLAQFSLTSRLAFLVVGPMVDVKLIALQAGTFGRRFVLRFAPLTLVVAVASAVLVGKLLL
ncbi:MAG TPA: permease [Mycobacteriales bacterium]|nr:permease [Mycobacteriales bacterium]